MISESPATPRYPKYRSAGIEWLEEIPSHWDVSPLFLVSKENDARNHQQVESNVLSLSYGRIVRRDVSLHHGLLPESFETYQVLQPGDIVLRLTDLQNDKRSLRVGLVPEPGIITSAYVGLSLRDSLESRFAYYLLHSYDVTKVFYRLGGGVRQTMKFADLRRLPIVLPPAQEQHAIADFLDRETAKIDGLVASKERLIELLQEKRTALITSAVTRGLDPNVPMKDSGIEWLGEIPAHWEVIRTRFLCDMTTGDKDTQDAMEEGEYPFFVRSDNVERLPTYTFDGEGVLTSGDGAGVGKIFHHYIGKFDFHQRVYLFCHFRRVVGRFFYYFVKANLCKVVLALSAKSTVDSLRRPMLQDFPVAVGPEQAEIVAFLDRETENIDALTAKAHQAIALLKEFRTALISAAVTGKIDVRGQAA